MDLVHLLVGCLGTWRLTHLLQVEEGPWALVAGIRRVLVLFGARKAIDCHYCLSVWMAAPFAWALVEDIPARLLLWPALSAGSIFLELGTAHLQPATYSETEWSDTTDEGK